MHYLAVWGLSQMARGRKAKKKNTEVEDYRHDEKRKNNPPSGMATYDRDKLPPARYSYDPHLDPQLVWAGKAEHTSFEVDTVSLHIHERISTHAILRAVQKNTTAQTNLRQLFSDPELPLDKAIEFYQHDVDWANRLILGDSLVVMNSLLQREGMAGKVQCIYIDPPYGIKYASNFQPSTKKRDVKDGKDEDLTREPEQIKAYRDTWELGIHSYLSYLRDRLLLARELLSESGSVFVQISDENVHLVRCIMDEVFGRENFVSVIPFRKKNMPLGAKYLDSMNDYLILYAKERNKLKYRILFKKYTPDGKSRWNFNKEWFRLVSMRAPGYSEKNDYSIECMGKTYRLNKGQSWIVSKEKFRRLLNAGRIEAEGDTLSYKLFNKDFPYQKLTNFWDDTAGPTKREYTVETSTFVIERCILMTTDPGDLVLDPTCGSGTTAYVAEKWGRRWIAIDTSRVALAIARQRLLTATFPYYQLQYPEQGVKAGFIYKRVPHITLKAIANNPEIDTIYERYHPQIEEKLKALNTALNLSLREWEVPREKDESWDDAAKLHFNGFWQLKREMQKEMDASIQRNADYEVLYDQPEIDKSKVRVSGPITVESIPRYEIAQSDDLIALSEEPTDHEGAQHRLSQAASSSEATAHVQTIIDLLRKDGITFKGGVHRRIESLTPLDRGVLHAEGELRENGSTVRVAVSVGPKYGPITVQQVDDAIAEAKYSYDLLLFAGFSFDPSAQAVIDKNPVPNLKLLKANMAPDILVGDLLKTSRKSQLFTVFGEPDVELKKVDGSYVVELKGVDCYDPNTGEVYSASEHDIAAWFLDCDYDRRTFCITQAFFPGDRRAWKKLERALKGVIDEEKFEALTGMTSIPFEPGEHRRAAVKVIDHRGNETIKIMELE